QEQTHPQQSRRLEQEILAQDYLAREGKKMTTTLNRAWAKYADTTTDEVSIIKVLVEFSSLCKAQLRNGNGKKRVTITAALALMVACSSDVKILPMLETDREQKLQ